MKEECNLLLYSMLGSRELVEKWWDSPNKNWNGEIPRSVPLGEVIEYLNRCAHGGW